MAKKKDKPVAFCTFCLRPYTDFDHLVSASSYGSIGQHVSYRIVGVGLLCSVRIGLTYQTV